MNQKINALIPNFKPQPLRSKHCCKFKFRFCNQWWWFAHYTSCGICKIQQGSGQLYIGECIAGESSTIGYCLDYFASSILPTIHLTVQLSESVNLQVLTKNTTYRVLKVSNPNYTQQILRDWKLTISVGGFTELWSLLLGLERNGGFSGKLELQQQLTGVYFYQQCRIRRRVWELLAAECQLMNFITIGKLASLIIITTTGFNRKTQQCRQWRCYLYWCICERNNVPHWRFLATTTPVGQYCSIPIGTVASKVVQHWRFHRSRSASGTHHWQRFCTLLSHRWRCLRRNLKLVAPTLADRSVHRPPDIPPARKRYAGIYPHHDRSWSGGGTASAIVTR